MASSITLCVLIHKHSSHENQHDTNYSSPLLLLFEVLLLGFLQLLFKKLLLVETQSSTQLFSLSVMPGASMLRNQSMRSTTNPTKSLPSMDIDKILFEFFGTIQLSRICFCLSWSNCFGSFELAVHFLILSIVIHHTSFMNCSCISCSIPGISLISCFCGANVGASLFQNGFHRSPCSCNEPTQ